MTMILLQVSNKIQETQQIAEIHIKIHIINNIKNHSMMILTATAIITLQGMHIIETHSRMVRGKGSHKEVKELHTKIN